jgi:hypothetical protein
MMLDLDAVAASTAANTTSGDQQLSHRWYTYMSHQQPRRPRWPAALGLALICVGLAATGAGHPLARSLTGQWGSLMQTLLSMLPFLFIVGIFSWSRLSTLRTERPMLRFYPTRRLLHRRMLRSWRRRPFLYRDERDGLVAVMEGTMWLATWEAAALEAQTWRDELAQIAQDVEGLPGLPGLPGLQAPARPLQTLIQSLDRHLKQLAARHEDVAAWSRDRDDSLAAGIQAKRPDTPAVRLSLPRRTRTTRRLVRSMQTDHRRLAQAVQTALHGSKTPPQP